MFNPGDAVVHPMRGAGVLVDIEEREWQGTSSQFYEIELLGREPSVRLMIPVEEADELGLRPAIEASELERVWSILTSEPEDLPSNHKTRHKLLRDKLQSGDIFQVAGVLRDLTRRRKEEDGLTTRGERIYEGAVTFLIGELAAAKGVEVAEAEAEVRERLGEILRS